MSVSAKEVKLTNKKDGELHLPQYHLSDFDSISKDWMEVLSSADKKKCTLENLIVHEYLRKEEKTVSFRNFELFCLNQGNLVHTRLFLASLK